jgi:CheY-like chemotaxis protein
VVLASATLSLHNSALVNRIARRAAGAATKTLAHLGRQQIVLNSGVHHVRSKWRQVEIQPGTQTEDHSAKARPGTAGAHGKGRQVRGRRSSRTATVGVGVTAPLLPPLQLSAPTPVGDKKKRVLLVDTSQTKRELRAEVLRKLGVNVDCAADIAEARSWWRAALYDLVLINMEKGHGHRDRFCDDIRNATPPQRLAFLVGQPQFLADLPDENEESMVVNADDQIVGDFKVATAADRGDLTQHWGILEASRRISVVRSTSIARTQAMRALPAPQRDSDGRPSKPGPKSTSLDDSLKEELR